MFSNERYLTRGINENVDISVQLALWNLIDDLKLKSSIDSVDYLHIFQLRVINNSDKFNQEIIHSQEQPPYKKEYLMAVENPVDAKIYIIDDGSYSTMLLAEEY